MIGDGVQDAPTTAPDAAVASLLELQELSDAFEERARQVDALLCGLVTEHLVLLPVAAECGLL